MIIQVFRPKQLADMARDYKLFADGVEVATITRGSIQSIEIPDDTKNLQARIDWCTSQTFPVHAITENGIVIKNSFASNIITLLLLPLYYITFGKGKYLKIESDMSR